MSLKNPVTPPGIDPGTVRLVVQRLNQYATPGPPDCNLKQSITDLQVGVNGSWKHKLERLHPAD